MTATVARAAAAAAAPARQSQRIRRSRLIHVSHVRKAFLGHTGIAWTVTVSYQSVLSLIIGSTYSGDVGDETYLCDKCNTKVTQERPWLFDYQPLSDEASDKHDWSHILVLFPDTSSDAPTLSVEERLDKLESTLSTFSENQDNARRDFEKSLSARMDRLENLMSQILNAVGKVRGRK